MAMGSISAPGWGGCNPVDREFKGSILISGRGKGRGWAPIPMEVGWSLEADPQFIGPFEGFRAMKSGLSKRLPYNAPRLRLGQDQPFLEIVALTKRASTQGDCSLLLTQSSMAAMTLGC